MFKERWAHLAVKISQSGAASQSQSSAAGTKSSSLLMPGGGVMAGQPTALNTHTHRTVPLSVCGGLCVLRRCDGDSTHGTLGLCVCVCVCARRHEDQQLDDAWRRCDGGATHGPLGWVGWCGMLVCVWGAGGAWGACVARERVCVCACLMRCVCPKCVCLRWWVGGRGPGAKCHSAEADRSRYLFSGRYRTAGRPPAAHSGPAFSAVVRGPAAHGGGRCGAKKMT